MRYFDISEFDSPDEPGSGQYMDDSFLEMLDNARHLAGIPFVISKGGGYRTKEYNDALMKRNPRASKTSSHLDGFAADIIVRSSRERAFIVGSLLDAGINRLGIANGFVHADNDPTKPADLIWVYNE